MKLYTILALICIVIESNAHAFLAATAVTSYSMPVYGMYITSDATCMTGLTAVKAMTKNPSAIDFAKAPSLGSATLPTGGIKCVVLVAKGPISYTYSAGTYTTTSKFGTNTYNDSNCNAGGTSSNSLTAAPGCVSARDKTVEWPDQVKSDIVAAGIYASTSLIPTDCTLAGDIWPIYISTNSYCIGEYERDEAIGGDCKWSNYTSITSEGYRGNILFKAPATKETATKQSTSIPYEGVKLSDLTAGKTSYKLVIDPLVGGTNGGGCGISGPPRFALEAL